MTTYLPAPACQTAHAALDFATTHPRVVDDGRTTSNTLVVLAPPDSRLPLALSTTRPLNRWIVTQRFVLRRMAEFGRPLTADEYRTARAAIANSQLRDRIDSTV